MIPKRRTLFRDLGADGWVNLFMAAVAVFYVLEIASAILNHGMFVTLGADYRGFWSVGRAANLYGYRSVYDLNILGQIQGVIAPGLPSPSPAPFFTAFIPIFQFFALLPPMPSFWLWSLANLIVLALYLHFLFRKTTNKNPSPRVLTALLLSYPVFHNLYWGQVNVWLVICIGEFTRNLAGGRFLRSGIWLAGLLLKPQTLILILPALLIQRLWKHLAGFGIGSLVIVLVSLALGGAGSLRALIGLWMNYLPGIPTNAPENMMNWRMLGLRLSAISSPAVGWGIAVTGMFFTFLAAVHLWLRPIEPNSRKFVVILLGTFAATAALTWHSHLHVAMVLLPLLLFLYVIGELEPNLIMLFAFLPIGTTLLAFFLGGLMRIGLLPVASGFEAFLLGLTGLITNLLLVYWATRRIQPGRAQNMKG